MKKILSIYLVLSLVFIPLFNTSSADLLEELGNYQYTEDDTLAEGTYETGQFANAFKDERDTSDSVDKGAGATGLLIQAFIYGGAYVFDTLFAGLLSIVPALPDFIFGTIDTFQLNFFNSDQGGISTGITSFVSAFYNGMLKLAMIIYIILIIYLAIRMLIATVGKQKALYKTLLQYWFIGLLLLGAGHFIMSYIIWLSDIVTTLFYNVTLNLLANPPGGTLAPGIKPQNAVPAFLGLDFMTQVFAAENAAENAVENGDFSGLTTLVATMTPLGLILKVLIALIYLGMSLVVMFAYAKRFFIVIFLMIMYPIVAVSYVFDKIGDRKAQTYSHWFSEFCTNVFTQPIHAFILTLIIGCLAAFDVMTYPILGPIMSIITLFFLFKGEQLLKTLFQLNSGMGGLDLGKSAAGLIAGGMAVSKGGAFLGKTSKAIRAAMPERFKNKGLLGKAKNMLLPKDSPAGKAIEKAKEKLKDTSFGKGVAGLSAKASSGMKSLKDSVAEAKNILADNNKDNEGNPLPPKSALGKAAQSFAKNPMSKFFKPMNPFAMFNFGNNATLEEANKKAKDQHVANMTGGDESTYLDNKGNELKENSRRAGFFKKALTDAGFIPTSTDTPEEKKRKLNQGKNLVRKLKADLLDPDSDASKDFADFNLPENTAAINKYKNALKHNGIYNRDNAKAAEQWDADMAPIFKKDFEARKAAARTIKDAAWTVSGAALGIGTGSLNAAYTVAGIGGVVGSLYNESADIRQSNSRTMLTMQRASDIVNADGGIAVATAEQKRFVSQVSGIPTSIIERQNIDSGVVNKAIEAKRDLQIAQNTFGLDSTQAKVAEFYTNHISSDGFVNNENVKVYWKDNAQYSVNTATGQVRIDPNKRNIDNSTKLEYVARNEAEFETQVRAEAISVVNAMPGSSSFTAEERSNTIYEVSKTIRADKRNKYNAVVSVLDELDSTSSSSSPPPTPLETINITSSFNDLDNAKLNYLIGQYGAENLAYQEAKDTRAIVHINKDGTKSIVHAEIGHPETTDTTVEQIIDFVNSDGTASVSKSPHVLSPKQANILSENLIMDYEELWHDYDDQVEADSFNKHYLYVDDYVKDNPDDLIIQLREQIAKQGTVNELNYEEANIRLHYAREALKSKRGH